MVKEALGLEKKFQRRVAWGNLTPTPFQNWTWVSLLNGPLEQTKEVLLDATSLATCDNYYLTRKNDSYQLVIWNGQVWGERF